MHSSIKVSQLTSSMLLSMRPDILGSVWLCPRCSYVINGGHNVSISSRCAASSGSFSSLWVSQTHECSRHVLDRQENLSFVLVVIVQRCCVRLVSVVVFSGSRHFGQYLSCLADSALWVTLILVHFGQWVRGLPSWKL